MAQLAIVETVFKSVIEALPTELGALLGQELSCSETNYKLVSKDKFFSDESRPKSSISHLNVVGDQEGKAFLILPTRTSIIFGGTLIMLPQDQIEENAKNEKLDGEVADAYGEVANILAGVLTQIFLDKYSKNLRFVRADVEEFDSSSVDIASDLPFPPNNYFSCSSQLNIGGNALGQLEIIVPAALLDLEEASPKAEEIQTPPKEPEIQAEVQAIAEPNQPAAEPPEAKPETPPAPARPTFSDAKKIADVVLKATIQQVSEEVGALLGQTFVCSDLNLEMVTKSDFFSSHCIEKSILTHLDVTGSTSGKIYLLNQLKDAILMGGTLIMLPEEEIESSMGKGVFDGEVSDAYGEVANILSGGLTQTFMDRFPQQLRFVKTTSEPIVPTKLTLTDDTPFPEGLYYLASSSISLQGKPLSKMHLLFPAEILGLDAQTSETMQTETQVNASQRSDDSTAPSQAPPTTSVRPAPQLPPADATPIILVITDAPDTAESISLNLKNDNCDVKVIGYKDDVRTVFSAHPVLGIFLLMSEVGEKGFSVAIKLQSSGYTLPPVIAGGPEWTRSSVLQAVKYGARDILITPASDDEIRSKATQHISIPA